MDNSIFEFFSYINEATEKEDKKKLRKLIFNKIIDKYELNCESGCISGNNIVVRGKKGQPIRTALADDIFSELDDEFGEYEPKRDYGGGSRSDKAPNISFKNNIKIIFAPTEGTTSAGAAEYEKAIINGWNYLSGHGSDLKMHPDTEETGLKLASLLKEKGIFPNDAKGIWFGSKSMGTVSEFWKKHTTRPDSTPKTDIIIGENSISLKMGKAAQLASPKIVKAEGEALFYTAAEQSNLSEKILKELDEYFEIENGVSKLGRNKKEIIAKGEEYFKINHNNLTDKLRNLVSNNKEFAYYITKEAMTGKRKFGGTSKEEAIAEYLLVGDFSGEKLKYEKIEKDYVEKISEQLNIYVAWKSAGGSKYATMRLTGPKTKFEDKMTVKRVLDEVDGNIIISFKELDEFANSLGITDNRLDENIKDIFNWVKNKLIEIAKKGLDKLLELFNLEIDSVEILNNEDIDFWR